ncbi:hypothetical protein GUITHDRAFT_112959 [Guillardia theta CCMP2712]|uniref:PH domain-containing protein n=1 Tax=Guillardia theta (strain CCMP2712) TaxID=905079 RepID=L1IYH6_GUITC|nr:hypothetical protein GUITHDRAFT_112959 [Guillardia theta CCMP2712]EKX40954.1 hypothetical protein GUITHDRAFT_112959 [Guillardia theta CCMP2712]|eukprot:XP_005827934.1 hypothetical protein GUITHDRAFT_112959 [Guillardia theta CCMP2712]
MAVPVRFTARTRVLVPEVRPPAMSMRMPNELESIHQGSMMKKVQFVSKTNPDLWRSVYCACTERIALEDVSKVEQLNVTKLKSASWLARSDPSGQANSMSHFASMKDLMDPDGRSSADLDLDDTPPGTLFQVQTESEGNTARRNYVFKCSSAEDAAEWVEKLSYLVERSKNQGSHQAAWLLQAVRSVHRSRMFQKFVAICIFLSFVNGILAAELVDGHEDYMLYSDLLDIVFTGIFCFEVSINLASNWFRPFFSDGWNVFDLVSVSGSVASALYSNMPVLHPLRAIRILRAIRLLDDFTVLKEIIQAVLGSIKPVANSLLLLGLVTCIYATLAVNLFRHLEPTFFGTFSASFFTMCQMCTGDSWASSVVRSMFFESGQVRAGPAAFFISYMIIGYMVLMNIVVAILLGAFEDEFLSSMNRSRTEEINKLWSVLGNNPLDPLCEILSKSKSMSEFKKMVQSLHRWMDIDSNGHLGHAEIQEGLSRILGEKFFISKDEFTELMAEYGDNLEEISPEGFEEMVMNEFNSYVIRNVNKSMLVDQSREQSTKLGIKWLLMQDFLNFEVKSSSGNKQSAENSTNTSSGNSDEARERNHENIDGIQTYLEGFVDKQGKAMEKLLNKMDQLLNMMSQKYDTTQAQARPTTPCHVTSSPNPAHQEAGGAGATSSLLPTFASSLKDTLILSSSLSPSSLIVKAPSGNDSLGSGGRSGSGKDQGRATLSPAASELRAGTPGKRYSLIALMSPRGNQSPAGSPALSGSGAELQGHGPWGGGQVSPWTRPQLLTARSHRAGASAGDDELEDREAVKFDVNPLFPALSVGSEVGGQRLQLFPTRPVKAAG